MTAFGKVLRSLREMSRDADRQMRSLSQARLEKSDHSDSAPAVYHGDSPTIQKTEGCKTSRTLNKGAVLEILSEAPPLRRNMRAIIL